LSEADAVKPICLARTERGVSSTWMGDELVILHRVTAALDSAGIAYMVTGSIALSVYAEPRMTRDVDLVVELSGTNGDRIIALFASEFHFDPDRIREAARHGGMFNLIHTATIVKVDCIARKTSPFRLAEFERRRRVELAGQAVFVVSAEDLLLSKLDWARDSRSEVQLRDVRSLMEMRPELDWDYVDAWAVELGLSDLLAEVRR